MTGTLPDCTYCGQPVIIDIDIEGAVEVCTGCGIAQSIVHEVLPGHHRAKVLAEMKRAVRQRQLQRQRCRAKRCDCPCHDIDRPLAA